jgi:transcriptional regulator with GAF, ATPase, and Fis domain
MAARLSRAGRKVNRGVVEIGTFEVGRELAAAEDVARAAAGGRDPFADRTGDFERHYLLAAAGVIMPYRVYVPTTHQRGTPTPLVVALPQTLALAIGGSLFLDEVGVLSADMQARLLSVLPTPSAINVRIISSTNRDLYRKVRDGEFLEPLYDRLTMLAIDIPPLRARLDDIPFLVQDMMHKRARRLGRRAQAVDPQSLSDLSNYSWPGNVRELANLVERALVMQDAPVLKVTTDPLGTTAPVERAALVAAADLTMTRTTLAGPVDFDDTLSTGLHVVQRDHILRVLDATHWVIEGSHGAALKLGLKPATLRHRMKKLGISRAGNAGLQAPGGEARELRHDDTRQRFHDP